MFGRDKEQLWEMLINSWNFLAEARGERLKYFREKGSSDWYVVAETMKHDNATHLAVHLVKSEASALSLIREMRSAPEDFDIGYLRRSWGPMVMSTPEDFSYNDSAKWLDALDKYGTTYPVPWAWQED